MTDLYPLLYRPLYGEGDAASFPLAPLDLEVDLLLGQAAYQPAYGPTYGATWVKVTSYVYQREGTSAPVLITRGRPDQTTTVNPSRMTLQLNNRAGQFSPRNPAGPWYGQLGRNTPVRVSVPGTGSYLRLADDAVSSCACPDSAALRALGSPDIRIDLRLGSHVPCLLVSKWSALGTGWALALNGDGSVTFTWTSGGTVSQQSTSGLGLPVPLGRVMIRAMLNAAAGTLTVWTAPAMGGAQVLLAAVPGTGATSVDGAPGQPVIVGYNPYYLASYGVPGLLGQVYELQAWQGSGGTDIALAADPLFAFQGAGSVSFADACGNTWSTGGTAEISARSYRYHGEMSGFPVAWDPTETDVWVGLTSSGVLRRLQQGNAPVESVMRRKVSTASSVIAYWPAEDGQAATQVASGLPGGFPMTISGKVSLGADSSSFLCSGPLPGIGTGTLIGLVGSYADTGTIVVRVLLNMSASLTGLPAATVFGVATSGSLGTVYVVWSGFPANSLEVTSSTLGGPLATLVAGAGAPAMLSLELTSAGGLLSPALRLLSASGIITSSPLGPVAAATGRALQVVVNPDPVNTGATTIGQVFLQSALEPLSAYIPIIEAYNGETAGNRFARLCSEHGIAGRVYGYPATSAVMGPQTAGTLTDLLQECETADLGLIYEPREAMGLGYRTLASMTARPAAVTLDYEQAHLGLAGQPGELAPVDDDMTTINDVLVTRGSLSGPAGSSLQVQLDDGSPMSISPPPDGVGDYNTSATVNVEADTQLPDVAGWMLHIGTVNEERIPSVPLNLARTELAGLAWAIQDAGIGDTIGILNPPPFLPPGTITQTVFGVTERLGGYWFQVEWNTVPGSAFQVAVADDLSYGRADTDGSQLASPIGTGDLSASVTTTGPSGIIWTTSAADFPLDIIVDGEVMTVSAISGTGLTQAFTISARAVNGVVKAHSATADVRLYPTPVLALA
jgi:hypothetical protein